MASALFRQSGGHGKRINKSLLVTVGLILVFGLIMLMSASTVVSYNQHEGDRFFLMKRQLIALAVGGAAFFVLSKIDYRKLKKIGFGFFILSFLLLLVVFIPALGQEVNDAQSWIEVFGQRLQPSEFVKLSFLMYLSAWLAGRNKGEGASKLMPFLTIYGIVAVMMIMQPDYGTLAIITAAAFSVYFVGTGKYKNLLLLLLLCAVGMYILVFQMGHMQNRFKCVTDPGFSPLEHCYQINQSLIAVGSGGLWGRGLGESRQKFLYLPEVQNDFIFAVVAEETGFIFAGLLIGLYLTLAYIGYKISRNAPDDFGKYLAAGITSWLVFQAILNIGGVVNLIPMTGVPLPLVSYGGSALMASLAGLGMIASISRYAK